MNLLFTSVGRRSYLIKYFRAALEKCGGGEIHVMNSSSLSPVFPLADKATVSPLIYDSDYIPFLLNYCRDNRIDALISLFDIDLPLLAANKEKFMQIGTKVVVSSPKVIDICNDKWKTYLFLTKNGYDAPATFNSLQAVSEALASGSVTYPLVIKPRWGMGSIGVHFAENDDELRVFHGKVQKEILNSYLKYESACDKENCVIFQQRLAGEEHGMDVINDLSGEYCNAVVKKKYAMRSGETDCAATVSNELIKDIGKRLSRDLHHIGNLDVDVFYDGEKACILEMNARFGGGYPFSHAAGVDLPLAIVRWLKSEEAGVGTLKEKIGVLSHKDISIAVLEQKSSEETGTMKQKNYTSREKVRGGGTS